MKDNKNKIQWNQPIRVLYLFIGSIVCFVLAYLVFGNRSLIGSAFSLLFLILFIFSIIQYYRERKQKEKSKDVEYMIDWIKEAKEEINETQIRDELISKKYKQDDINEAVDIAYGRK